MCSRTQKKKIAKLKPRKKKFTPVLEKCGEFFFCCWLIKLICVDGNRCRTSEGIIPPLIIVTRYKGFDTPPSYSSPSFSLLIIFFVGVRSLFFFQLISKKKKKKNQKRFHIWRKAHTSEGQGFFCCWCFQKKKEGKKVWRTKKNTFPFVVLLRCCCCCWFFLFWVNGIKKQYFF